MHSTVKHCCLIIKILWKYVSKNETMDFTLTLPYVDISVRNSAYTIYIDILNASCFLVRIRTHTISYLGKHINLTSGLILSVKNRTSI